jgi:hypothetical protein
MAELLVSLEIVLIGFLSFEISLSIVHSIRHRNRSNVKEACWGKGEFVSADFQPILLGKGFC